MMGGIVMRALALVLALLGAIGPAGAAEIDAMMTTAMKAALDDLLPRFERANGHTIRVIYGPSGALLRRFNEGAPADLFVTDVTALDQLLAQGKIAPERVRLASTGIGICVKKGAPHPDVSTPEAFKRALLAAKTIGHTDPKGGGLTAAPIMAALQKLGIAEQVAPKIRLAAGGPSGRVSTLVATGEAEIGMQMVSELLSNPELDVIGMLPAEFQLITVYSAGIAANAKEPDAARALIDVLSSPQAAVIYKSKGLGL